MGLNETPHKVLNLDVKTVSECFMRTFVSCRVEAGFYVVQSIEAAVVAIEVPKNYPEERRYITGCFH